MNLKIMESEEREDGSATHRSLCCWSAVDRMTVRGTAALHSAVQRQACRQAGL